MVVKLNYIILLTTLTMSFDSRRCEVPFTNKITLTYELNMVAFVVDYVAGEWAL
jgi:hypothetical protein